MEANDEAGQRPQSGGVEPGTTVSGDGPNQLTLREWHWPLPRWYNGFSPAERVLKWQVVWWMIDHGHLPRPSICSVTGLRHGDVFPAADALLLGADPGDTLSASRIAVAHHSEDYYDLFALHAVCAPVHRLLHRRFFDPAPWQTVVASYSRTGEEWFAKLMLKPVDVAARLRQQHGAGIADMLWRLKSVVDPGTGGDPPRLRGAARA